MTGSDNAYEIPGLMRIGAFAAISGISVQRLAAYDRSGLFKPHYVDKENGYRFYSPQQLTSIRFIPKLQKMTATRSSLAQLQRNRTPELIQSEFRKYRHKLEAELKSITESLALITTYDELISEGIGANTDSIIVRRMPELEITEGRDNVFKSGEGFVEPFVQFVVDMNWSDWGYPVGGLFSDMNTYKKAPSRPTRFFCIHPEGKDTKPSGLYMIAYTKGYYGETNKLPQRMIDFAAENALEFTGPVYNIYLFDEVSVTDSADYLLQASVRVRKKR